MTKEKSPNINWVQNLLFLEKRLRNIKDQTTQDFKDTFDLYFEHLELIAILSKR